jgi:glycosyltransferase involved in cell wall biosynthesis
MPKVSICIPAYKQTEFLAKTLDSIKIQNFKDFEIIITDDSPDDSVEQLINSYNFEGKLRYIKNKIPKGSPANWNEAIKRASGEYIKIMHHDDWFTDANSLSKFVQLLDNKPDADFAFSGSMVLAQKKNIYRRINHSDLTQLKMDPFILLWSNIIGVPSATIHRKSLLCHYDEDIKWLVDLDFYIQSIKDNPNIAYCQEPLINVHAHGSYQVTNECLNNRDIEIPEYIYVYRKYIEKYNFQINKEHLNFLVYLFSRYKITTLERLEALSLKCDIPESIRNLFNSNLRRKITAKSYIYILYKSLIPYSIKKKLKVLIKPF